MEPTDPSIGPRQLQTPLLFLVIQVVAIPANQEGTQPQELQCQPLPGDPVAGLAIACGSSIASQGKDIVHKELHRSVSVNKFKFFGFDFMVRGVRGSAGHSLCSQAARAIDLPLRTSELENAVET